MSEKRGSRGCVRRSSSSRSKRRKCKKGRGGGEKNKADLCLREEEA